MGLFVKIQVNYVAYRTAHTKIQPPGHQASPQLSAATYENTTNMMKNTANNMTQNHGMHSQRSTMQAQKHPQTRPAALMTAPTHADINITRSSVWMLAFGRSCVRDHSGRQQGDHGDWRVAGNRGIWRVALVCVICSASLATATISLNQHIHAHYRWNLDTE